MAYNSPDEFILLSTLPASNSASLSFTSLISSTYPVYYVKIRSLLPATDATSLLLTYSTDNGATYLNSNYFWANFHINSNASFAQTNSASDSSIHLIDTTASNTSTNLINMQFYLFGFAQSVVATIMGKGGIENTSSFADGIEVGGMNSTTTAVNAIQFAMSSGNITSGTISLYGMKI